MRAVHGDTRAAQRLEAHGREFAGAPVFMPDGRVASEACFARGVREPRSDRSFVVTTSHGPPGAAATTITHRCRAPTLSPRTIDVGLSRGSSSPLEELLTLTELRDAVLQWLPCCDMWRVRRVSTKFFEWAASALAVQRSPAVLGNAQRDYSGLNFTQQLDPRCLTFKAVGPAPADSSRALAADDCAQIGDRIFSLRGSVLSAAQLPAPHGEIPDCAPPSPVMEPVSSPEPSPRQTDLPTPRTASAVSGHNGAPASPVHPETSSELVWDEVLRIPAAGQCGHKQAFDSIRVGGRMCVDQDGAILLVGGGKEHNVVQPPLVAREQAGVDGVRAAAEAAAAVADGHDRAFLGVTAQVLRVDPSTGLWRRLPDLIEPRRDCIVATLPDGALLVAGGAGMNGALSSAEVLDPDVSDSLIFMHARKFERMIHGLNSLAVFPAEEMDCLAADVACKDGGERSQAARRARGGGWWAQAWPQAIQLSLPLVCRGV